MTITPTIERRPPAAARRVGYAVAMAINIALLLLINGRPGWTAVPFLTEDTTRVLAMINASLLVGVIVNLVEFLGDPRSLVALGGIVTSAVGAVVLVQLWRVFPFDFGSSAFDWGTLTRVVLAIGLIGSVIGVLAQTVTVAKAAGPGRPHRTAPIECGPQMGDHQPWRRTGCSPTLSAHGNHIEVVTMANAVTTPAPAAKLNDSPWFASTQDPAGNTSARPQGGRPGRAG